jgi:hypothetical protein
LIAGLAILLWSLGLPSLQFANAANLSSISDTITDSAPSASANHDIDFTTPTSGSGVATSSTIVITFPSGGSQFSLATIGEEDIDLLVNSSNVTNTTWSVATTATSITITLDSTSIATNTPVSILIGTNATNEGSPNSQITNPGAEGSYEITVAAGSDSGATRVVILSSVEVTASVDTVFTFAVAAVGAGTTVNGVVTTGTSSSTTIPFGTLSSSTPTTTAQQLSVSTNASNGYSVTVQTDGPLESSAGGVIDGFVNGSDTNAPTTWSAPTALVGNAQTWGHWGLTSDDATTTSRSGDEFASGEFVAASTSPRVVMEHNGPANGTGTGVGTTYVGYQVQISSLQEAGDDYSTTLTYIATPTF